MWSPGPEERLGQRKWTPLTYGKTSELLLTKVQTVFLGMKRKSFHDPALKAKSHKILGTTEISLLHLYAPLATRGAAVRIRKRVSVVFSLQDVEDCFDV